MEEVDDNFDDVYADLETFDVHEKLKKANANSAELRRNLSAAVDRINALKADNKALKLQAKSLRDNQANLLQTARNELRRKDTEIQQLRREKDDLCFRRTRPIRVEPLPAPVAPKVAVSTCAAQTDFTFGSRDTVDVLRRSQTHLELSVVQEALPEQPINRLDERQDLHIDRQYHNAELEWLSTAEVQRPFGHRRRSMFVEQREMQDRSRDSGRNPLHRDRIGKDAHRDRHRDDPSRRTEHKEAESHRDSRPEKRPHADQSSRRESPVRRGDKRKGDQNDCLAAAKRVRDGRREDADSAERHHRNRRHDDDRAHRADEKRSDTRTRSREPPVAKQDRSADAKKSSPSDAKRKEDKNIAPIAQKESAQQHTGKSKERTKEHRGRDSAADKSIPITKNGNADSHKEAPKLDMPKQMEHIGDVQLPPKLAGSARDPIVEQPTKPTVNNPANLPYQIVPCEVQLDNLNDEELNRLREAYSESLALESVISDDVEPGVEQEVWHVSADNGLSKRIERVSGRRDGSNTPNEVESCTNTTVIAACQTTSQEPRAVCQQKTFQLQSQRSDPDSTGNFLTDVKADKLRTTQHSKQLLDPSKTIEPKSDKSSRLDIKYTSTTLTHGHDNVRQSATTSGKPKEAEESKNASRTKHENLPQSSLPSETTITTDKLAMIPRLYELPNLEADDCSDTNQPISHKHGIVRQCPAASFGQTEHGISDQATKRMPSTRYESSPRSQENESPNEQLQNIESSATLKTSNHKSDKRNEETRKIRKKKHDKHREKDNDRLNVRTEFNDQSHTSAMVTGESSKTHTHKTETPVDDEECPDLRNAKKCLELIKQIEILPRSNSIIYPSLTDRQQSPPQPSTSIYRPPPAALPPPSRPPPPPPPTAASICYRTSPLRISSDPTLLEELSMDVDYELTTVHDPHRQTNDIISLFDALETPRKSDPRTYHSRLTDTGQSLITPTPTELMTLQAHGDNSCSYQLATVSAGNQYSQQPLAAIASITTRSANMPELSDQSFLNEILATEDHLFLGASTGHGNAATEEDANQLGDQSFIRQMLSADEHSPQCGGEGPTDGFQQPPGDRCQQAATAPAPVTQPPVDEEFFTSDRDLSSLSDLCAPIIADMGGKAPTVADLLETLVKTPQHTGELNASGSGANGADGFQSPAGNIGEDVLLEREMRLDASGRSLTPNETSLERKRIQTMTSSRATYYVETTEGKDEPEELVLVITRKTHRRKSIKPVLAKKS